MENAQNEQETGDFESMHGRRFENREQLLDEAKNFYAAKGYAISIKNSKKDEYITIGCDLGGVYRDRRKTPVESRTKETSTRLINCPFKIQGKNCLAIDNEFQEIKTQQESERIRVSHRLRIPYFKLLVNRVSTFALNLLYEQYEMAKYKNTKSVCTGNFMATMGLPCAHMMINCKEVSLPLEYVNSQWRIDIACLATSSVGMVAMGNEIDGLVNELQEKYKQMPIVQQKEVKEKLALMLHSRNAPLLEPNVESHKGRPLLGSKRKEAMRSTRRDPSKFEIVEASLNNKSKKQRVTDDVEHEPWSFSMSGSRLSHIDLNLPLSLDSPNYHS